MYIVRLNNVYIARQENTMASVFVVMFNIKSTVQSLCIKPKDKVMQAFIMSILSHTSQHRIIKCEDKMKFILNPNSEMSFSSASTQQMRIYPLPPKCFTRRPLFLQLSLFNNFQTPRVKVLSFFIPTVSYFTL